MQPFVTPGAASVVALAVSLLASTPGAAQAQTPRIPDRVETDLQDMSSQPDTGSTEADGQEAIRVPAERMDADAIYRQIFGKERPAIAAGKYSVIVDQVNVGEYDMDPETAGGSVEVKLLSAALIPIAIDQAEIGLRNLVSKPRVGLEELRALGFSVVFDPGQLVLRISIPPELRSARELALRSARRRAELDYVKQAWVSAYVSARAGIDVIEDSTLEDEGVRGFATDIDAAINVGGFALQGRFRYDERRTHKFTRRDIRLTYDDVANQIRYELGDLSVGRRPFQLAPRLAGIAAYREFPINPYRNIRPVPEQGFQLDEPARVEVYLNGAPVRTYSLNPGRYSLRDFPLVPSAANDIELRLTYASGRVEVLSFPAFSDIELLEPGLIDFAFNAGVPYRDEDGKRTYDDGDYNMIGYIRRGFTSTLTAGLSIEGNRDFTTLGSEAVWASPVGSFAVNAATDIRDPGLDTGRLAMQYAWRDTDPARGRSVDAQLILTGRNYRTLNQLFGGNIIGVSAQARAGQSFGPRWRGQIYGGYEDAREFGRRYYGGLTISHELDFGALSFGAEYRRTPEETDAVFRLSFSMPLGGGNLSASYSSENNTARAEYTRLAALGVGSLGYGGGIERRDDYDRQYARLTYIGNRFEAGIEQDHSTAKGGARDLRTSLTFGTALVMADGAFAIARPINNSFAIVGVDDGAGNYDIAVEPRRGFGSTETLYSAHSDWLGPAVIPTLPAYFDRTLQVDAPDAPAGTSIGGQVFSLRPGYRSGYRLKVGSSANASIVGTLTSPDGNPIAFATGEARRLGAPPEEAPLQLFTNGSGRFFLEGVRAEEIYRLTIGRGSERLTTEIAVPDGTVGIHHPDAALIAKPDAAEEGAQP